jgi:hypothetical protein
MELHNLFIVRRRPAILYQFTELRKGTLRKQICSFRFFPKREEVRVDPEEYAGVIPVDQNIIEVLQKFALVVLNTWLMRAQLIGNSLKGHPALGRVTGSELENITSSSWHPKIFHHIREVRDQTSGKVIRYAPF